MREFLKIIHIIFLVVVAFSWVAFMAVGYDLPLMDFLKAVGASLVCVWFSLIVGEIIAYLR